MRHRRPRDQRQIHRLPRQVLRRHCRRIHRRCRCHSYPRSSASADPIERLPAPREQRRIHRLRRQVHRRRRLLRQRLFRRLHRRRLLLLRQRLFRRPHRSTPCSATRSRGASARDAATAYIGFARAGRIPLSITPAALNRGRASLPAPCYRFPQRRCSAAIIAHVVVQRDYSFVCHRMCPSGAHRETITPDPPYWGFRRGVPIRFV